MRDREIIERICDAYRRVAAKAGVSVAGGSVVVTIADIRDVSGVHPDDLAAMLTRLHEDGQVSLIPRDDLHPLDGRERDAAIWCGGEYKHLVTMGPP
jgi:predicted transcriptional regulator of viral defense system